MRPLATAAYVSAGTLTASSPGLAFACWIAARNVQTPADVAQLWSARSASVASAVEFTLKTAAAKVRGVPGFVARPTSGY